MLQAEVGALGREEETDFWEQEGPVEPEKGSRRGVMGSTAPWAGSSRCFSRAVPNRRNDMIRSAFQWALAHILS